MDLKNIGLNELQHDFLKVCKLIKKVNKIINQSAHLNTTKTNAYRTNYINELNIKRHLIFTEIQRRAELLELELIFKQNNINL